MRNSATALSVCLLFALALPGCGGGGGEDLSLHGARVSHTPANTTETPTTESTTKVSLGGNLVVSNAEGVLNSSEVKLSVQVPDLCVDSAKGCTEPQAIDHDSFFREQETRTTVTFDDGTAIQCDGSHISTCAAAVGRYNSEHDTSLFIYLPIDEEIPGAKPASGNPDAPELQYEFTYSSYIRVIREDHAEHRRDEGTIGEGPLMDWVVSRIGKNRYRKGTSSQTVPVDVFHYSVAAKKNGDNDYTSFGYWAYEIQDAALGGTLIFRVTGDTFAGGTNPATNISRVGGKATYRGEAAGYATWRYATAAKGLGLATFDGAPVEMMVDLEEDDEFSSYVRIDMSGAKWQDAHHHASDKSQLDARFPTYSKEGSLILQYDETNHGLNYANDGTFATANLTANLTGNLNGSENVESETIHQATDAGLQGRFYGPAELGDDFPQQAAGTFYFERDTGTRTEYYRIDGAFGAEK